ncbi:MAG: CapA family protein [Desulfobacter postgatei]|uniref:CapA family protein n=1 Tax=Desulfobacter postgatei TaxID=2293 RepID=UPI0023F1AAC4|nr:CapA family protein [Desulfobacter postgatei]MDD4274550.1 CapA family protein [Desulfobacter postgatei]
MCNSFSIQISLAGDIFLPDKLARTVNNPNQKNGKSSFLEPFKDSDVILCNFEAPISDSAKERERKQYNLKNDLTVLDFFDDRFVLSLANNHIMDYGKDGLKNTITFLKEKNLIFAGAGKNIEEASRPAFVSCKGIQFAVICAADPRFQPAGTNTPGTLPAKPEHLIPIIHEAKDKADYVFISIHAGMEFTSIPTPFMIKLADQCLQAGAKIVKFHHAHCLSGQTENEKGIILWGGGNYVFPYIIPGGFSPWFQSAVWKVTINRAQQFKINEIIPVQLDRTGFPHKALGKSAAKINAKINKYSSRINKGKNLYLWRLFSVLHPVFIWLALNNYAGMARRMGLNCVFKQIVSTFLLYSRKK